MTTPDDSGTHATLADSGDNSNSQELARGSNLGRYVIIEPIGSGGMGTVYRAYDPQLNRGVALKILSVKHADFQAAERAKARLIREAQALAQLSHPNVVAVHDAGTFEDDVFIAMELVEGKTLDGWMRQKKRSLKEVLEVMVAAGRGLSAAHKAALVHRDFKPGNVIVGDDGRVRVLDFGLARAADQAELSEDESTDFKLSPEQTDEQSQESKDTTDWKEISSESSQNLLQSPLTNIGGVFGTPLYMAPEQHLGLKTDERTDQFGFCVVLYEALYGKRPFLATTMEKLKREVVRQQVHPPRTDTDVPAWLWQIIQKGLSVKPEDRYTNIDSLLEDIEHDPEEIHLQKRLARRRKLLVVSLILLSIALPVGVWYEFAVRRSGLCKNGPQEVAKVWNQQTRVGVHDALAATGVSYSKDTARLVVKSIDMYTAEWKNMFSEACRATQVTRQQSVEVMDLRMQCLKERRREMGFLIEVLNKADAKIVEKAAQAATGLASIADCANITKLRKLQERIRQPATKEVARKVEAIRETLMKVTSLERTGRYKDGLGLAKTALIEAEAIEYLPVEAEAAFWVGNLQDQLGLHEEAAETLEIAMKRASASYHDELQAKSINTLAFVVGYRLAKPEKGIEWARLAESAGKSPAVGYEIRGTGFNNRGAIYLLQREYTKAVAAFQKSTELKGKVLGPEDPRTALALQNLGIALYRQGEHDKAIGHYRTAMTIMEKALGPDHPNVAITLGNLGVASFGNNDYDKALKYYRRALDIFERAFGSTHPRVASVVHNIGAVLEATGEFGKSLEHHRRALAIFEKTLSREHPYVAASLNGIGTALQKQGEHDKALKHYRKVLAIRKKALGPRHPRVAITLISIGTVFVDQARYQEAREPLELALDICEKKTCEPELHSQALFSLAQALVATDGDKERVNTLATQAREIYSKTPKRFEKELEEVNNWLQKYGKMKLAKKAIK